MNANNNTWRFRGKNILFALSTIRLSLITAFILLASQMFTVEAKITNVSSVKNLIVPYNHYSQFRISGSGLGDEAIDDDLAVVELSLKIQSDVMKNLKGFKSQWTFDIMVFSNNLDYECYIEAVNLLLEENIKKACVFVSDPTVFKKEVHDYEKKADDFLYSGKKSNEYFIVVDNT